MYGSGFLFEKKSWLICIFELLMVGYWNYFVSKINIEIGKNFEFEVFLVIFNFVGCFFGLRGFGGIRWEFFGFLIVFSMDFVCFFESGFVYWYFYDV